MVQHRCLAGERFAFNVYRNWVQLLLRQPDDAPVVLLIREGVTQGEPLLMVLYGINLPTLAEELRYADPTVMYPFYANDMESYGSARRSAAQLRLLVEQGLDREYFFDPSKSLFITDNPEEKEAAI